MYIKRLVGVVGFCYGIASVAAQCDEVRTGWGEDMDNELGMTESCTRALDCFAPVLIFIFANTLVNQPCMLKHLLEDMSLINTTKTVEIVRS